MNNIPKDEGLLQRIKESPRTVSALIIILIVAAAIYAFSGPRNQPNTVSPTETLTEEVASLGTTSPAAESPMSPVGQTGDKQTQSTPKAADAPPMPEARQTDTAFVEVAQPGDGVTHLARRASGRWLKENQAGYDVTAEHNIYIEDYIKDQIGRKGLALGQEQEVAYQLITDAVAAAKELNEQQLKNLSKYTK